MLIIIIAGVTMILAICIVTVIIRCKCGAHKRSQESYPHFDAASIPPNYDYASSSAHQRSSWACTFKGGQQQQVNTHIWETPLPEPNEGEYTLPASMKKQLYPQTAENAQGGRTLPSKMSYTQQTPCESESDYTLPSNMRQTSQHGISSQPHYTMPVKMKQQQNTMSTSSNSDYTIPVLPHPVPDTPDSESEYTMPTGVGIPEAQERSTERESSLRRIL